MLLLPITAVQLYATQWQAHDSSARLLVLEWIPAAVQIIEMVWYRGTYECLRFFTQGLRDVCVTFNLFVYACVNLQ